jgi:hypothetical protein
MLIETYTMWWAPSHVTAFASGNSQPSRLPTTTTPSGDGVINLGKGGTVQANGLVLTPIGTGASGTFTMNVYGWAELQGLNQGSTPLLNLWIPTLLCQVTCTMNTGIPGISGAFYGTTVLWCSTIVLNIGNANVSTEVVSPGNPYIGHFVADVKGFKAVELTFAMTGSDTGACLFRKV